MSITVKKSELLEKMQSGYAQFTALLASLSEQQMTTPNVNGNWSIKDNIAHLSIWQKHEQGRLQALKTGQEPTDFVPEASTEDEQNEHVYQANKDRALADVLADFHASYQSILKTVEETSEESLNAPYPWYPDSKNLVWEYIVGNTFGHYEEHSKIIQHWLER